MGYVLLMHTLYGIPNCDTVKKARSWLEKHGVAFEFVDFKKSPPQEAQLKRWSVAFGGLPVNRQGLTYKKHKEAFESLTPGKQLVFAAENASMIKRPILEKSGKVLAFGFSEAEYGALF